MPELYGEIDDDLGLKDEGSTQQRRVIGQGPLVDRKRSEWTLEPEAEMRQHHPDLFATSDFEDEV